MSPKIAYKSKIHAHHWFFLAACLYALFMVPLSLLARHGYGPAGLALSTGHAFEMLFGFALALIAGYLLGPLPRQQLAILLAFWLLARIAGLAATDNWMIIAGNALFAALLAQQLLPRLWVAKKWRNRMLVPLLGMICVFAVISGLANQLGYSGLFGYLLNESVQLFALLMLFMGGRILAPAAAGEFYRQGKELQARVQPHIEAGLIITVSSAFLLSPLSASLAGMLLMASAALAAIRLLRWQLWHCRKRPDLICLGIGYAWLALGLFLLGWVKFSGGAYSGAAVHAITVGALGTLASNVMVRVSLLHSKQYPSRHQQILAITATMSIAAILRISADFSLHREIFLAASATAWSSGFLLVAAILVQCLIHKPRGSAGQQTKPTTN